MISCFYYIQRYSTYKTNDKRYEFDFFTNTKEITRFFFILYILIYIYIYKIMQIIFIEL